MRAELTNNSHIGFHVTVIVPVYNVEDYIERCANSLFGQTLSNLEIIFVDDCTQDKSVEIIKNVLELYPHRKTATRIIKMPSNGGLAAVRREGIIAATGDYLIHCDGDDWVDADLYEKMYLEAVRTDADIVVADEVLEYSGHTVVKSIAKIPSTGKDIMKNWYKKPIGLFCHNKLVRRKLYSDNNVLPWLGLNMWEDNGLFARLFYYADNVVQLHGPVYHYNRTNIKSITSGYGMKQVEQMIDIAQNLTLFFESKPDASEFQNTIYAFQFLAKINLITDSFENYKRYKDTFKSCKAVISDINPNAFSFKGKIRFYMARLGLIPLFITMFKVRNLIFK